MGVPPKCMVYNRKYHENGCFDGTPPFYESSIEIELLYFSGRWNTKYPHFTQVTTIKVPPILPNRLLT